MATEQLPVTTAAALILKISTALLIMLAATLVLVHAEIHLSHPLMTRDFISDVF